MSTDYYTLMLQAYFTWASKKSPAFIPNESLNGHFDRIDFLGSFRVSEWDAYVKARTEYLAACVYN